MRRSVPFFFGYAVDIGNSNISMNLNMNTITRLGRNADMGENGMNGNDKAWERLPIRPAVLAMPAVLMAASLAVAPTASFAAPGNAVTDVRILQIGGNSNENSNENGNTNTNENGNANSNENSNSNANSNGNANANGNENGTGNANGNGNAGTGSNTATGGNANGGTHGGPWGDAGGGPTGGSANGGSQGGTIAAIGSILQTGLTNIWLWIIVAIAAALGIVAKIKRDTDK